MHCRRVTFAEVDGGNDSGRSTHYPPSPHPLVFAAGNSGSLQGGNVLPHKSILRADTPGGGFLSKGIDAGFEEGDMAMYGEAGSRISIMSLRVTSEEAQEEAVQDVISRVPPDSGISSLGGKEASADKELYSAEAQGGYSPNDNKAAAGKSGGAAAVPVGMGHVEDDPASEDRKLTSLYTKENDTSFATAAVAMQIGSQENEHRGNVSSPDGVTHISRSSTALHAKIATLKARWSTIVGLPPVEHQHDTSTPSAAAGGSIAAAKNRQASARESSEVHKPGVLVVEAGPVGESCKCSFYYWDGIQCQYHGETGVQLQADSSTAGSAIVRAAQDPPKAALDQGCFEDDLEWLCEQDLWGASVCVLAVPNALDAEHGSPLEAQRHQPDKLWSPRRSYEALRGSAGLCKHDLATGGCSRRCRAAGPVGEAIEESLDQDISSEVQQNIYHHADLSNEDLPENGISGHESPSADQQDTSAAKHLVRSLTLDQKLSASGNLSPAVRPLLPVSDLHGGVMSDAERPSTAPDPISQAARSASSPLPQGSLLSPWGSRLLEEDDLPESPVLDRGEPTIENTIMSLHAR